MKKLLRFIKPYWFLTLMAPVSMALEVFMDLLQPTYLSVIVDQGIMGHDMNVILRSGGMMVLVALVGAVGGIACTYFSSKAGMNFGADIRKDMFANVQSFSFAETDRFRTSSLITRLTNDVTQIQMFVTMSLRMMVRAPLQCIGGIIMVLVIDARLALWLLLALPLVVASVMIVIRIGRPLFDRVQKRLDDVNAVMQENLSAVRVVKAFVRQGHEVKRFKTANDALAKDAIRVNRIMGGLMPIMMLLMNGTVLLILYFAGGEAAAGRIQIGQIMALINYITQILFSLMAVSFFLTGISRAQASVARINAVLDTESSIQDAPHVLPLCQVSGGITFAHVDFSYPTASGKVLEDICFTAQPGQTVAIVGSTGAGKTSLVHLIPRFYDAEAGTVRLDGQDVREVPLEQLRSQIALVLQETVLFSGTIAENIRWGNPQATDEQVQEAACMAQAHDFITRFPDGYQTMVGQRGVTLSGGQKQRMSIARALLKQPRVLILDDSTSAVDMTTEARLQAALKEAGQDMTTFIIAQRITSVMGADLILVMDSERIVDSGTHGELIQGSQVYRDIYESQLGEGALSNA